MRKKYIIASLVLVIIYFLFRVVGFNWIENLELVTLNFRMNMRGTVEHSGDVVIVAIDDRSLSEQYYEGKNPWPWRRDVYARIIDRLGEAGAKSIVMDVSFDTYNSNDLEGDRAFAESLFSHPYVVIGTYLINNREEFLELASGYQERLTSNNDHLRFRYKIANPDQYFLPEFFSPYLQVPPESLFMNCAWAYGTYEIGLPGEDGMYRNIPLIISEEYWTEQEYGSMILLPNISILGLCAYYGLEPGDYVIDLQKRQIFLGDRRAIPVDVNGYFTVNYYGKRAFSEVSVVDVLKADVKELESLFNGKIVLIGYTATSKGLFDLRPTPFNKNEAGIQIHATMIQNILDENYLRRLSFWQNLLIIFLVLIVFSVLLTLPHLRASTILEIAYMGAFNVIAYILFLNNIWIDLLYPNLALFSFLIYNAISRVYQEHREKLQVKNYFSKYVPEQVVEEILKNPDQINPGGVKMEISVLFSDIIGFTTIAEELDPEDLVRLLNEYLTEMTVIIKDQFGGTLDKFVGDAIVAIFGAPFTGDDDPFRAVSAALAMHDRARILEQKWKERGEKVVIRIGVGINTGQAVVGNIGSPDRLNYTCIGDTVNVAARLQDATRVTNTSILISATTYEQVKDYFMCTEISDLYVKGKKDSLTVYSVEAVKEREVGMRLSEEEGTN